MHLYVYIEFFCTLYANRGGHSGGVFFMWNDFSFYWDKPPENFPTINDCLQESTRTCENAHHSDTPISAPLCKSISYHSIHPTTHFYIYQMIYFRVRSSLTESKSRYKHRHTHVWTGKNICKTQAMDKYSDQLEVLKCTHMP